MKIAVNTRLLIKDKLEGIGWFTYETLRRLTEWMPEVEFVFIFDRKPHPDFIFADNVTAVVAHPQARHPVLWYLFFEYGVAGVLKRHRPDLFLSPDGWLCLRTKVKSLPVIHDLNFEAYPEFISPLTLKYYRRYFHRFARKATRIATVSEFTKSELQGRYQIPPSKIDVVYNGINQKYHPLSAGDSREVRRKYTGGAPYFLFVGLIHPRKNLLNQVDGFFRFRERTRDVVKYVVVGERYGRDERLDSMINASPYAADVIFPGRQGVDVLADLYGAALALTYVSFYEGFGIPIVEAMQAGTAVITASETSMPEVAGDAALTVPPDNPSKISEAMERLYSDVEFRNDLIAKGHRRKKAFHWDRTARLLMESIHRAVEEK